MSSQLKNWLGPPPRAEPPDEPGYELYAYERLQIGWLGMFGLALLPVWFIFYVVVLGALGGRTSYSADFTLQTLLGLILVFVGVTALHELLHGLPAVLLGAKPAFGAGPGYFYATFREPMNRWGYLTVGLAPLVAINTACIVVALLEPRWAGWLLVVSLYNFTGASGDLWMSYRILKAPRNARFYDLADGFAVLVPTSTASPEASLR